MREGFDMQKWILKVKDEQPRIAALVIGLMIYGAKVKLEEESNDIASLHFSVKFSFVDNVVVTIGIILMDHQTESDLVIETMTTLPEESCREGFGSQAISKLLLWARNNQFKEVRATQVSSPENEAFWKKNGFTKAPPPNPCNDFVWHGQ